MMNEMQVFTNEQFGQVRTVLIEGEPWFVGKDVAVALGYSKAQPKLKFFDAYIDPHGCTCLRNDMVKDSADRKPRAPEAKHKPAPDRDSL